VRFPPAHQTVDRGHGRIEQRSIQTAPVPAGVRFPHAQQVLVLTRHVTDLAGGHPRTEVVYGITSLDARHAGPARLAVLVRGQWQIENRAHWVRDVTFDEDRSQVGSGHGPQVMATLRNLAISRLRLAGQRNIAAGLRWAGWDRSRPRPARHLTHTPAHLPALPAGRAVRHARRCPTRPGPAVRGRLSHPLLAARSILTAQARINRQQRTISRARLPRGPAPKGRCCGDP
jgi:hypothetical protein